MRVPFLCPLPVAPLTVCEVFLLDCPTRPAVRRSPRGAPCLRPSIRMKTRRYDGLRDGPCGDAGLCYHHHHRGDARGYAGRTSSRSLSPVPCIDIFFAGKQPDGSEARASGAPCRSLRLLLLHLLLVARPLQVLEVAASAGRAHRRHISKTKLHTQTSCVFPLFVSNVVPKTRPDVVVVVVVFAAATPPPESGPLAWTATRRRWRRRVRQQQQQQQRRG